MKNLISKIEKKSLIHLVAIIVFSYIMIELLIWSAKHNY
jgi:hypothetical protein